MLTVFAFEGRGAGEADELVVSVFIALVGPAPDDAARFCRLGVLEAIAGRGGAVVIEAFDDFAGLQAGGMPVGVDAGFA